MKSPPQRRAPYGAVAIGHLVRTVAAPAFQRHGLGHGEIACAWSEIVGPEFARISRPVALAWPRGAEGARARSDGATLTVAVEGPRAIELQHAAPRIMEAVNTVMGYRAVTRLRLVRESSGAGRRKAPRQPVLVDDAEARAITAVRSPALARALARLGAVAGSR